MRREEKIKAKASCFIPLIQEQLAPPPCTIPLVQPWILRLPRWVKRLFLCIVPISPACLSLTHCTTSSVEIMTSAKSTGTNANAFQVVPTIGTSDVLGNPSLSNHRGKSPSYSSAISNSLHCNNGPAVEVLPT